MADKTAALSQLLALGLPTPASLVVARGGSGRLSAFVALNAHVPHWYLRFDERLAPGLPRVAATKGLIDLVSGAVRTAPGLAIIVQERVRASQSGVLALTPDAALIEYVQHELQGLLRLGVTPSRVLLARDGARLAAQSNIQELHYQWRGLEFVGAQFGDAPHPLPACAQRQLQDASEQISDTAVLEWTLRDDGQLVFLDYRSVPQGFLGGRSALLRGLEEGNLENLPGHTIEYARRGDGRDGHFALERPLYEYAASILPLAESLSFKAGGILSHLCVYAADQGVYSRVGRPGPAARS
jgi:hypothetical protein